MTVHLTEDQRQAVQRGEPVRVEALGLAESVVLQAELYDEEHQSDAELAAWAKLSRKAAANWAKENPF